MNSKLKILDFKNTIIVVLSIVAAVLILRSQWLYSIIAKLGNLEYAGAFLAGMFFAYGFTTAPAIAVLYMIGANLNPFAVAFLGASGAVLSDFLIFKFMKKEIIGEIKHISNEIHYHPHMSKRWMRFIKRISPLIGGIIIASPFPDELAAAFLSSINFDTKEFLLLAFLFKFLSILFISSIATI